MAVPARLPTFDANGRPEGRIDRFAVPQVLTFSAVQDSAWRTYLHGRYDEAYRHGREDALLMRRDPALMALLQERKHAVASLKCEVEVDDENDPAQKELKDGLSRILESIPDFYRLCYTLLDSIWYGRYAVQFEYKWGTLGGRRVLGVADWSPVNGDKIGYGWDGTPYVLIHGAYTDSFPRSHILYGTAGPALWLRAPYRERFTIATHERDDADYLDSEQAGGVHGVGVRSRLFWLDWLRREFLAWVVDYMERVGLGVTLYQYDASNPAAKAEAEKAAHEQNRRSVILWPTWPETGKQAGGVTRLETPTGGAQVLLGMQEHIESWMERYVVGQSMSSGADNESGLGGSGRALFAADTKYRITKFDAQNLQEALTGSERRPGLLWVLKKWGFPEFRDTPARLVFAVDQPDPEATIGAASILHEMGVTFDVRELRRLTGLSDPTPTDEVTVTPQQQEQMAAQQQMMMGGGVPGMGGAPGAPGGPGAGGAAGGPAPGAPPEGVHPRDADDILAKIEAQDPEFAALAGGAGKGPKAKKGRAA